MTGSQSTFSQSISNLFAPLAQKLGLPLLTEEKKTHSRIPPAYTYLESDNPAIMAAHGLSLMIRPYIEAPVHNTESNRKAADLLYTTCNKEPRLVASMLLQDVIYFKPAEEKSDKPTHRDVLDMLFDGNVMTFADDYKNMVEHFHDTSVLERTLPGTKRMKLASSIQFLDETLASNKRYLGYSDRDIQETVTVFLPLEEMKQHKRENTLEHLSHTERLLEQRDKEFKIIKGLNQEMDNIFIKKMENLRENLATWKTENGFNPNERSPQRIIPPRCIVN